MRVILQTSRIDGHLSQAPGDIINLPNDVARRMIDNGEARPFEENAVQTASTQPTTRGTKPTRRSRKVKQ